jgi:hypothetical protein
MSDLLPLKFRDDIRCQINFPLHDDAVSGMLHIIQKKTPRQSGSLHVLRTYEATARISVSFACIVSMPTRSTNWWNDSLDWRVSL